MRALFLSILIALASCAFDSAVARTCKSPACGAITCPAGCGVMEKAGKCVFKACTNADGAFPDDAFDFLNKRSAGGGYRSCFKHATPPAQVRAAKGCR